MHQPKDLETRGALDALRRIVRALRLAASDTEKTLHISMAQLFVLQRLAAGAPRSIGQLAVETMTDRSSVSVVVGRLVERGLVQRRADQKDARRALLSLTAGGRRLLARAPQAAQTQLIDAIRALPDRRRRALALGLDEIARAVDPADAGDPTLFFEPPAPSTKKRRRG